MQRKKSKAALKCSELGVKRDSIAFPRDYPYAVFAIPTSRSRAFFE